jgi:hypothetical protein
MYYTPETSLNHVFEDLRKTKAPNSGISEGLFILFCPKPMSHGMLHHIESKYSLNCCIYLIWFEFET